jgi:antitoxin (DNA-binding transcriptional repressor) of toxin-antitoxin stability system
VYNVHVSKRYSVSHVRERLSDALDEAERGVPVFIERHGTRFQLSLAPEKSRRTTARKPRIEILDPAVADGAWSWEWSPKGMKFRSRRRQRPRGRA